MGQERQSGAALKCGPGLPYLIWDYDGTIHETMKVYKPGIASVVQWLRESHGIAVDMPSDERISSWLGMSTAAMWEDFLPRLPGDLKREAGAFVGRRMKEEILAGHAGWYPGTEKMLDVLREKGYSMAVLSNCDEAYARLNWEAFDMGRWFDSFYDCGSYGFISKAEILEKLAEDRCFDSGLVVIGDRASDLEAAERNSARFIWCAYGYGTREEIGGCTGRRQDECDTAVSAEHLGRLL